MTRAVARGDDPDTSWQAAESLDPDTLRASQRYVLGVVARHGPMTDERLVDLAAGVLSPSGARTRRAELVAQGLVFDTGERAVLASGRRAIVWGSRRPIPPPDPGPTLWDPQP